MKSNSDITKNSKLTAALFISIFIFIFLEFIGDSIFGFMQNGRCFKYLGCNNGFFGYDALVHFFGGVFVLLFIVWLGKTYPKLNFLRKNFWKNVAILIAIVAFVGILWEMWEFTFDHISIAMLHGNASSYQILQAGNSDTMGDLTFSLFGALSAIFSLKLLKRKIFERQ